MEGKQRKENNINILVNIGFIRYSIAVLGKSVEHDSKNTFKFLPIRICI
jgi:hypothetical protein